MPVVGQNFGDYRVTAELGRGGMGAVYLATQTRLNRPVALKVLDPGLATDPSFSARFHHEATLLARLDSPHVVQVYDHGTVDGSLYLAMQYIAGGDLATLLRSRGALPPDEALSVFKDICTGLADAHARGVIHRDVKPSNVLLRHSGGTDFAYLCDFGIAQSHDTNLTQTGAVAGTWAFMAPERLLGSPATPQSDIYSAGCVLWAMLTGQNLYSGTDVQIAMAHSQSPIPMLAGSGDLTRGLNQLLQRVLAKDPSGRPPTALDASAMAGNLSDLVGMGATADPTRLATPRPSPPLIEASSSPSFIGLRPESGLTPLPTPRLSRGRQRLFLAAGFLALVAFATAAVLGVANWVGGGKVASATAPSVTASATGLPPQSPVGASAPANAPAGSGYTCWDGTPSSNLDGCTPPEGSVALRYLFPELANDNGGCVQKYYDSSGITFECSHAEGVVRYVFWYNSSDAKSNFAEKYASEPWSSFMVDGIDAGKEWRPYTPTNGKYVGSVLWINSQFSFTVIALDPYTRDQLMEAVRLRAMDQIQGYKTGEAPREGAIG